MARYALHAAALLLAALLSSGCVYRLDIQQGNLLTLTDVEQVTVGMSRSQVRYLLGTPMVSDPFAPHRWDYVYRMTYGRKREVITAHFLVRFDGDTVSSVEKLDLPEPPPRSKSRSWKFWQKPADEVAPELPKEPVAPAPLPDVASPTPTG